MTLKQVKGGLKDAALVAVRTPIGAPAVAVSDIGKTGLNLLRRGSNIVKKRGAEIFEAFSHRPFQYKNFEKITKEDKFGKRWKKRLKNSGTAMGNTFRWTGNTFNKLFVAPAKTVAWYAPAMAIGLTVGNGLHGVKDIVTTTRNLVFNAINPVLEIGNQGKDKKPFTFKKLENSKTISWKDALSQAGVNEKKSESKNDLKEIELKEQKPELTVTEKQPENITAQPLEMPLIAPTPVTAPVANINNTVPDNNVIVQTDPIVVEPDEKAVHNEQTTIADVTTAVEKPESNNATPEVKPLKKDESTHHKGTSDRRKFHKKSDNKKKAS